ncbi:MAG: NAD(P)/FAD-dependent oxidoreductase [Deltaproteobacteria bacterium]|nr:NAD(P)/FAD-dependent oxidoreductase [Deltaproteobacteria bacterium]
MNEYDVTVIGAGAAGLMAGGASAFQGAKTIILEKMNRPGRKIKISGKGRCNITNTDPIGEFILQFGKNGRFLHQAFARFFSSELIELLESMGVEVVFERGGRVFPESGNATDVVDALVSWARSKKAVIRTEVTVDGIIIENLTVKGVHSSEGIILSKNVIVTTGGCSYPLTGSTGDGYRFARESGHTVVSLHGALVPLDSRDVPKNDLNNLKLVNINATLNANGKKINEKFGDLVFTESGVSGPVILALSSQAIVAMEKKHSVDIVIDLKPALDSQKLDARILRDINNSGNSTFRSLLNGLLPIKLIPVCISALSINPEKKINQLTSKERKRLGWWLKNYTIHIDSSRPIDEAIVTAGGVSLSEIDPKTMASKKIKGLYFAGEVLDIDAQTGGYNLQAAFSTGHAAGMAAAKSVI